MAEHILHHDDTGPARLELLGDFGIGDMPGLRQAFLDALEASPRGLVLDLGGTGTCGVLFFQAVYAFGVQAGLDAVPLTLEDAISGDVLRAAQECGIDINDIKLACVPGKDVR